MNSQSERQKWITTLAGLAIFAAAAYALHNAFAGHSFDEILAEFRKRSFDQIASALALTALSYFVLMGYDLLGLHYIQKSVSVPRAMLTSFLGFTFANNLGFLGGAGLRLRFYVDLGLTSFEVGKLILFSAVTFWLGFASLGGVLFLFDPPQAPAAWMTPHLIHGFGGLLAFLVSCYLGLGRKRWSEFTFLGKKFVLPNWRVRLAQAGIASLDWIVASSVLYVLLPVQISFPEYLAAFLLALILGLASNVPGGLGVFESVLIYMLPSGAQDEAAILASLLMFRLIYYVLPLSVATVTVAGHELLNYSRRSNALVRMPKTESKPKP